MAEITKMYYDKRSWFTIEIIKYTAKMALCKVSDIDKPVLLSQKNLLEIATDAIQVMEFRPCIDEAGLSCTILVVSPAISFGKNRIK